MRSWYKYASLLLRLYAIIVHIVFLRLRYLPLPRWRKFRLFVEIFVFVFKCSQIFQFLHRFPVKSTGVMQWSMLVCLVVGFFIGVNLLLLIYLNLRLLHLRLRYVSLFMCLSLFNWFGLRRLEVATWQDQSWA